jgi:hypothetical protein
LVHNDFAFSFLSDPICPGLENAEPMPDPPDESLSLLP